MKTRFFVGLAFIFSVFLLCAVSSRSEAASLKSSIIGKWVRTYGNGDKQIEFLKDGTFITAEVAGDYRFFDDNRLRMDAKIVVVVVEVSIDEEGGLNLKDPTGKVTRYIPEEVKRKRELFLKIIKFTEEFKSAVQKCGNDILFSGTTRPSMATCTSGKNGIPANVTNPTDLIASVTTGANGVITVKAVGSATQTKNGLNGETYILIPVMTHDGVGWKKAEGTCRIRNVCPANYDPEFNYTMPDGVVVW